MGLTGSIVEVTFRLLRIRTARIRQETVKCADLDETIAACEEAGSWTYSVAWIDCLARGDRLGRGVMMRGEHARPGEYLDEALVGAAPPYAQRAGRSAAWSLNRFSVTAFNALYYGRANRVLISPTMKRFSIRSTRFSGGTASMERPASCSTSAYCRIAPAATG